ncbi:MAG: hypothetical protein JO306_10070 [Gemmatimonadetes bacterium]|nr:hypothetical protein [Gemmatimonadota bacterium]
MSVAGAVHEKPLSLRDSVRAGLRIATALTLCSLGLLTASIVVAIVGRKGGNVVEILSYIPLVAAGYYAAALLGGTVFWALGPLRRNVIGWLLTGIAVMGCVYGSVCVIGTLAYLVAGINLLELRSPETAWSNLLPVTTVGALVGGIPVGLFAWWKDRRGA